MRWALLLCLVGCGEGSSAPTDVEPGACAPLSYLPEGCADVALPDLTGTWQVTGRAGAQDVAFDLVFDAADTETGCQTATAMPEPTLGAFPTPSGAWFVGDAVARTAAPYRDGHSQVVLCTDEETGMLTLDGITRVRRDPSTWRTVRTFHGELTR